MYTHTHVHVHVYSLLFPTEQECLKSTFELIIPNCVPADFSGEGHPALVKTEPPFRFFNHLMEQIQSAVNDDRTMYAPLISRQVFYILLLPYFGHKNHTVDDNCSSHL